MSKLTDYAISLTTTDAFASESPPVVYQAAICGAEHLLKVAQEWKRNYDLAEGLTPSDYTISEALLKDLQDYCGVKEPESK